jgi:formamidopyrimidine-DNA glycosylase
MPELPEVETVCRGLSKALKGRAIRAVKTNRRGMRILFPPALQKLAGKVAGISRRAKYVLVQIKGGDTLILHLGMSGRLLVYGKDDKYTPGRHDHLILTLDNGARVVLNDPRRFGLATVAATKKIEEHPLFCHLGPEPLGKGFTASYLAEKIKGKKAAIKLGLMDQRVVVGVGNIYAAEALFMAGIDPRRAAGSLTAQETKKLVAAVREVLKKAIRAGGSSLRDYVQTDGELGYFQHHFAVYGKAGQRCRGCTCDVKKTGGVHQAVQAGRSTFYCPVKQA